MLWSTIGSWDRIRMKNADFMLSDTIPPASLYPSVMSYKHQLTEIQKRTYSIYSSKGSDINSNKEASGI